MAVNISGLRRNIKNVAHNYTDAQARNEPPFNISIIANFAPKLFKFFHFHTGGPILVTPENKRLKMRRLKSPNLIDWVPSSILIKIKTV